MVNIAEGPFSRILLLAQAIAKRRLSGHSRSLLPTMFTKFTMFTLDPPLILHVLGDNSFPSVDFHCLPCKLPAGSSSFQVAFISTNSDMIETHRRALRINPLTLSVTRQIYDKRRRSTPRVPRMMCRFESIRTACWLILLLLPISKAGDHMTACTDSLVAKPA